MKIKDIKPGRNFYLDMTTGEYPFSKKELQIKHQGNPKTFEAPSNYKMVFYAPPIYDKLTQTYKEIGPQDKGTHWELSYELIALPQSEIDENIAEAKAELKEQVMEKLYEEMFTNVTANFPNGPALVQFRDVQDRANLSDAAQTAQALLAAGSTENIDYRTEDNAIQSISLNDMITIAVQVSAQKQAVLKASWLHKDNIDALVTAEEIHNYDINANWPEVKVDLNTVNEYISKNEKDEAFKESAYALALQIEADITSGTRTMPTEEELITELDAL
jgi:hypothetical protein